MASYSKTPTSDLAAAQAVALEPAEQQELMAVSGPTARASKVLAAAKWLLAASAVLGAASLAWYHLAPGASVSAPAAAEVTAPTQLEELSASTRDAVRRRAADKDFQRFLNASIARVLAAGALPGARDHDAVYRLLTPGSFGDAQDLEDEDASQNPPKETGETEHERMTAYCVVDVTQATAALGTAVVFLYEATSSVGGNKCPGTLRAGCAAAASTIVASLGWTAAFLSMAASHCAGTVNAKAACAADITALIANLGNIATAGSSFGGNCAGKTERQPPAPERHHMKELFKKFHMNLPGKYGDLKWPTAISGPQLGGSDRDEKVAANFADAQCSFDVVQAASFLVRGGVQISDAAQHCPEKRKCSMDVLNLIASFSWAASAFSLAASDCTAGGNDEALCAADVTNLLAATGSFSAFTISSTEDCSPDRLAE